MAESLILDNQFFQAIHDDEINEFRIDLKLKEFLLFKRQIPLKLKDVTISDVPIPNSKFVKLLIDKSDKYFMQIKEEVYELIEAYNVYKYNEELYDEKHAVSIVGMTDETFHYLHQDPDYLSEDDDTLCKLYTDMVYESIDVVAYIGSIMSILFGYLYLNSIYDDGNFIEKSSDDLIDIELYLNLKRIDTDVTDMDELRSKFFQDNSDILFSFRNLNKVTLNRINTQYIDNVYFSSRRLISERKWHKLNENIYGVAEFASKIKELYNAFKEMLDTMLDLSLSLVNYDIDAWTKMFVIKHEKTLEICEEFLSQKTDLEWNQRNEEAGY